MPSDLRLFTVYFRTNTKTQMSPFLFLPQTLPMLLLEGSHSFGHFIISQPSKGQELVNLQRTSPRVRQ